MDAVKTGALIAQARKEKGMTQRELAERVYVSVQAVSKWELGRNFPDLSLMEPLAEELGLTVSELLAGERGESAQDELVRDTLRFGLDQLRPQIRRWKGRFIAALVLLGLVVLCLAGVWINAHTDHPQRETVLQRVVLTEQEEAMVDLLNNQGDGAYFLNLYDLTIADDMIGYRVVLELWTPDGMEQSWELSNGRFFHDPPHFSRSQLLAFRIPLEEDSGARYRIRVGGATVSGPADCLEEIPYLDNGMSLSYADRAVVDREHGAVLMEVGMNEDREGYFTAQILGRTNDPQPGTLRKGTASLILKLYWDQ